MFKLPSEMIGNRESDGWRKWWIFAVSSWIFLFLSAFVILFRTWSLAGQKRTEEISDDLLIASIPVACVVISNLFAGLYFLVNKTIRKQLLSLPTAASLACLSLSFVIAILCMVIYNVAELGWQQFVYGPEQDLNMTLDEIKSGITIGVVAFPLTFGLIFPLGIPLGVAIFLYGKIKVRGNITPMSWVASLAFSIFGWWLTVVIGLALGMGG